MSIQITDADVTHYNDAINSYPVDLLHAIVPRWSNYVGNGPNDAWNKGKALIAAFPQDFPGYASAGEFPHTVQGGIDLTLALQTFCQAEATSNLTGGVDPMSLCPTSDPEGGNAQTHDVTHGVANANGDFLGQVGSNSNFALSSLANAFGAVSHGDLLGMGRNAGAALFIGGPGSLFDGVLDIGRGVGNLFGGGAQPASNAAPPFDPTSDDGGFRLQGTTPDNSWYNQDYGSLDGSGGGGELYGSLDAFDDSTSSGSFGGFTNTAAPPDWTSVQALRGWIANNPGEAVGDYYKE